MVCRLTIGKKKYEQVEERMKVILEESEKVRFRFEELVDEDTKAFNLVMEAFGLPKETEEQKAKRSGAIQESYKKAALVPLETMRRCVDAVEIARDVAEIGNKNSISDAGVSALMFQAAFEAAKLNVLLNLTSIEDDEFDAATTEETAKLTAKIETLVEEALDAVSEHLS